jgi:hypothetical protein
MSKSVGSRLHLGKSQGGPEVVREEPVFKEVALEDASNIAIAVSRGKSHLKTLSTMERWANCTSRKLENQYYQLENV